MFGLFKPVVGDQEYVKPGVVSTPSVSDSPEQKVTSGPASAAGGFTLTVTCVGEEVHPFSITVRVMAGVPACDQEIW